MQKHITIPYEFHALSELSAADRQLIDQAIAATRNSYSPYSHFRVGAAALLADGTVFIGANQENAAFPSGLCAERTALFAAQAQHPEQPVVALAIAAGNANGLTSKPISPCGACRQVMTELEDRYHNEMRVMLYGTDGVYTFRSAHDLLPLSFIGDDMK